MASDRTVPLLHPRHSDHAHQSAHRHLQVTLFGYRDVTDHFYLSHCYTTAWDRLSNQFFCLCMYVCMYVSVGTITVALFNRSSRNLVRTFGV